MKRETALLKGKDNVKNYGAYLISALKNDYKDKKNKIAKQVTKYIENGYLRELKEASQIHSLINKYREYKFNQYNKNIDVQPDNFEKGYSR